MDIDSFYSGFGTCRFEVPHSQILAMFKQDKDLQSIVDTIVEEGNEDELCRAADLYLMENSSIDGTFIFEIGLAFSEYLEEHEKAVKADPPLIFELEMFAESTSKLGRLFFIGSRENVQAKLQRLY